MYIGTTQSQFFRLEYRNVFYTIFWTHPFMCSNEPLLIKAKNGLQSIGHTDPNGFNFLCRLESFSDCFM